MYNILLTVLLTLAKTNISYAENSFLTTVGSYFNDFVDAVKKDFTTDNQSKLRENNQNIQEVKNTLAQEVTENAYNFNQDLYQKYIKFANDRYNSHDYIDAYYFKQKALKIQNYKIVSPSNPFSFGIIPEDMEQFLDARKRLKELSIKSIVESRYGSVLADSYIAYDCWLEAFENGNATERAQRCRDRFIDNVKALEIVLFDNGVPINESVLSFSQKYRKCKTCSLNKEGYFCNAFYFNPNSPVVLDKMNIVIKKIQQRSVSMPNSSLVVMYVDDKSSKIQQGRLDSISNIVYNHIIAKSYVQPVVRFIQMQKNDINQKYYKDSILLCVVDKND